MARTGAAAWGIEIQGLNDTRKAFKLLGEVDTPFYRKALGEAADMAIGAINARAPGSMAGKAYLWRIRGDGIRASAVIKVRHPGAESMEFGRKFYWRGYTGRAVRRTGTRFKSSPGQVAKPFIGIIDGGHAIGAVAPRVQAHLARAVEREFERVANGGTP